MKWSPFKRAVKQKPKSKLREWREAIVFAVVVATLFRWSLVEAFVIPTPSMENSLLVGDYLFVSKFHYGARTPRTPLQIPLTHQRIWGTNIPSYLPWIQLPSYRLPGLREVKRGEPVVFNVPKDLTDPTERPLDLKTYLVKRCVAIHGDRIEIRDKQVYINGKASENPVNRKFNYQVIAKDKIHQRHLSTFGLDSDDFTFLGITSEGKASYGMLLTDKQAERIKSASFVLSVVENRATVQERSSFPLFPEGKDAVWSRDNYGPLVLPAKGMNMMVSDSTLAVYGEIIRKYEGHEKVAIEGGRLYLDGKPVSEYTFHQNYYFMMGDNRDNSLDSRYWGFVPEDHILGKPLFIWFSIDNDANLFHKIRWERLFNLVD
jgi:signal peptidase I